jgi:flagellin
MGAFSLLNNIASLEAENNIQTTAQNLQNVLVQLSTGSRLNTGANDPAGLAIADALHASEAQLTQASNNANIGVGLLQTADGSLAQVTNLLDQAVTIATEAANGGVGASQLSALQNEYQSIQAEINQIGQFTTFNGSAVFSTSALTIFLGTGGNTIDVAAVSLTTTALGLNSTDLNSAADAASALTAINGAVATVALDRGTIGATLNRLNDAQNVLNNQVTNLTAAENLIRSANIPQDVTLLSQYSILEQTGITALTQSNTALQNLLRLFT